MKELLLAPKQVSITHFILATIPLLGLLIYFLYLTYRQENDDFHLFDIDIVFLTFHVLWTIFAIYIAKFVPKRRNLIGRYLSEGEECLGDIIYDKNSRKFTKFHDYGYAVYPHPTKKKMIRKRVRVYQPYTRERITIISLPNKPLSGQAKVDIEIDLKATTNDHDNQNKPIAVFATFWYFFTLLCASYVTLQMYNLDNPDEYANRAVGLFFIVVPANIPFSYFLNLIRYRRFKTWLTNRGAIMKNVDITRTLQTLQVDHLFDEKSMDGSEDTTPYNMINEDDEISYQGSLPSHSV
jgi:hypothetical protein